MAPNRVRRIFVPTNPDLADILGSMDFDFENFDFFHFLDSKFLDLQVPRYLKSGLGRAGLEPWVGPARPRFTIGSRWVLDRFTIGSR